MHDILAGTGRETLLPMQYKLFCDGLIFEDHTLLHNECAAMNYSPPH
jgi:hypothetical protein